MNITKARETLAYIAANPEDWNQMLYSDCFAGITAKLDGWEFSSSYYFGGWTKGDEASRDTSESYKIATEILGLQEVPYDLFNEYNTFEDLVTAVDQIEAEMLVNA